MSNTDVSRHSDIGECVYCGRAATPAGVYVGKRLAYNVDLERLSRVPARIVRGFFGDAVAGDYRIVTQALSGFEGAPDVLTEIRVNLIAPLLATQTNKRWSGLFLLDGVC